MADVFLGKKLIVLYTISFANAGDEVDSNVGESEEGENSGDKDMRRKVLNDPYWKLVMSDDDDAWDTVDEPVAGTSTRGDETPTFGDDWHDFIDFDEEVGGKNDGDGSKSDRDGGDEEGAHEKATQSETTHVDVGGSSGPATSDGRLLDDNEKDEMIFWYLLLKVMSMRWLVRLEILLGLLSFKMWT